jgi:hypothetical protein
MRTTIGVPDVDLHETIRAMSAKTKRETVVRSLTEVNRRQRMAKLIRYSGTCNLPSNNDVEFNEQWVKKPWILESESPTPAPASLGPRGSRQRE